MYGTVKAIHDSETQKYHVAFVYGPEDRLLYFYDMAAPPDERFRAMRRPLAELQWKQIENGECPKWSPCLTSYADELRRRATLAGYTLPTKEAENLQRLLEVATDRDEGRITEGQARIGIAGQSEHPPSRKELDSALRRQLHADTCPQWVACVTFYADEVRRREVSLDPPTSLDRERFLERLHNLQTLEERDFERLLEIARDKDEGRIRSYADCVLTGNIPIATGRIIDEEELLATSYATGLRNGRIENSNLSSIRQRRPELSLHYEKLAKTLRDIGVVEPYVDDNGRAGLRLSKLGRLFEDETLAVFFSPAVKRTLAMKVPR